MANRRGVVMIDVKEQRAYPRFSERDVIGVTVVSDPDDSGLAGRTFFGLSRDLSEGGLSFSAHIAPSVDTILKLTVVFSAPARSIKGLLGRVAWVQKIPHGDRHIVGVDLSGSPEDALSKWKKAIAKRLDPRQK
jgi:hypothetical protein